MLAVSSGIVSIGQFYWLKHCENGRVSSPKTIAISFFFSLHDRVSVGESSNGKNSTS